MRLKADSEIDKSANKDTLSILAQFDQYCLKHGEIKGLIGLLHLYRNWTAALYKHVQLIL